MNNPLLQPAALPEFSKIKPEIIQPAIEQLIEQNREQVKQLTAQTEISWDSLIKPLSLMSDRLSKAWSPVRHLNSVKSSEALRDAYNACLPVLSEYSTEISQNRALFEAYSKIVNSEEYQSFDLARQKALNDSLLHFRLGGVELEAESRKRYQQIQKDLSELQSKFENNLLDSTQAWEYCSKDADEFTGLPDYAMALLQQLAEQKKLDGYRATLDMPCYLAIITYAENRELRQRIYEAYVTRASDQATTDKTWDNAEIMAQIVSKRHEKAKLLGFESYAEYSLQTKMASSVDEVNDFLTDLAHKSREAALAELAEVQEFAREQGFEDELQAWDFPYFSERLKQHRYQISDEDLKPYFAANRVINGLFDLVRQLYRIEISQLESGIDRWDESVSFYQIKDGNDQLVGQFYLDLYARENKRGGAWMDGCTDRYCIDGEIQIPVAYLTCNLTPPLGNEEALFTHDEVITLFHEFGHGLHHMLTRIDVPDVSGINGVEWDAVELPSQFMENFCWEKEALAMFARHYQTGEPLPDELFERMIAAKNFQSAMQMLRQLEFSLFDMRIHHKNNISSALQIQQELDQVREQVAVLKPPTINRFQNGFSHIFAGGYAAGYYSYKWAEVLSADAYAAFEEEGIFNAETGQRFLQCILEKGGSRPAMESFVCFRGREPEIDALLRHSGIS